MFPKTMKQILLLILGFPCLVLAQNDNPAPFHKVKDSVMRREIAGIAIIPSLETSLKPFPLKEIKPFRVTNTSISFQLDSLMVHISAEVFQRAKHRLGYKEGYLQTIDGKPYFGSDGGVLKLSTRLNVKNGRAQIKIPVTAVEDLYEPNYCYINERSTQCHTRTYCSIDNRRIYIYMNNSDGTGAYEVAWILKNRVYAGRMIDYGF